MSRSSMGGTRERCKEREDAEDRFEGAEDERSDVKWHSVDDYGMGSSNRSFERGNDRVSSRRVVRDKERAGSSGDRSELPKDVASERSPGAKRRSGQRKGDASWEDSEEGRSSGRGKRSRDDGWRDRSRCKEVGEGGTLQEDSDDGSNGLVRWRGDDSRGYGPQGRSEAAEDRGEFEGVARSSRLRTERTEDDRSERFSVHYKTESVREEAGDGFQLGGGRTRADKGGNEKPTIAGKENSAEMPEGGRFYGSSPGDSEGDTGGNQRESTGKARLEENNVVPENFGRLGRRSLENEENRERLKREDGGDCGRNEAEDSGPTTGRRRSGNTFKEPRISHDRKDGHGDGVDSEWGWTESGEREQEKGSGRTERERNRQRYNESSRGEEHGDEYLWERERRRDWEDGAGRMRERYKEGNDKPREMLQDLDRKRERAERERSSREITAVSIGEREMLDRERMNSLSGPNGMVPAKEGIVGVSASVPTHLPADPGRGILPGALYLPRAGGDPVALPGEYTSEGGDGDWEGSAQEERGRVVDGVQNDVRERHSTEDEPPPGLEQLLGPSLGRGDGNDGGMSFNVHGGRGRPKSSPSNRSRGEIMFHDGRPNFVNSPGAGLMVRGFQPVGKGARGGRGPGKVGRGGGRDGQRPNLPVISQLGPGMPAPLFSQLGPPGPIAGLGPGIMGPGAFPMPPFGGRMGWNGSGDMGMMNGPSGPIACPPRFVPGMGPGPPGLGPSVLFNSPGPGRGSPGAMSLGLMCAGNPPFGGRPMPGDRGLLAGRSISRGGGPSGRGPSRGEQNDYSQHFVDTGQRPQNFIRDVELADRFEEYPKLKELIARKDKLISERATPPMYLQCDLRNIELRPEVFGTKFDVILVDPPWEEYVRRAPGVGDSREWWSHGDIQSLRIEAISDTPAFIFLWVGDAEGLDHGRLCLKKWGFRRCEDICWVKTNRENPTPALRHDANTVLQHSKEHCLMGIKGTVRRSTDGHIIHANVDTDIIISEEPDYGSTAKPEELYHIIEHFAQGQRRIELFGEDHNIRAGWVTVGKGLSSSNFNPQVYAKHFFDVEGKLWQGGRGNPPFDAPHLVGTTSEIESLRPKSPPPRAQQHLQSHAANAVPPSGTNGNSKRTSCPNAPLNNSPAPGAAHAALVPGETGPVGSGGRAVSHTQIFKATETVIQWDTKPGETNEGIVDKATTEERSFATDTVEVLSEVESVL